MTMTSAMLFALPWRDLKLLLKHAGCKRADIRAIRTQWRARRSKMLTNVQKKYSKCLDFELALHSQVLLE